MKILLNTFKVIIAVLSITSLGIMIYQVVTGESAEISKQRKLWNLRLKRKAIRDMMLKNLDVK